MIAGQAKAEEWEREFQEAWFGPMLMAQAVMQFLSLPPDAHAQMQMDDQGQYAQMLSHVKRMKEAYNGEATQVQPEGGDTPDQPEAQQPDPYSRGQQRGP